MQNLDANGAINALESGSGNLLSTGSGSENMRLHGFYTAECRTPGGELVWSERADNLVTTLGANNALDNHLAGSAYTAAWYIGLLSATSYTTGPAAGDTPASHAGWAEDQNYTEATRPATSWGAAAARSKTLTSPVVFTMNATTTIKGCFLASASAKGATTGVLYSAGLFTGGDQPCVTGNTLTVTYTASA